MVLPEEQARLYRPRPELLPAAHVPSLPHYERLYQRSVEEPHGERRRRELPPGRGRAAAGRGRPAGGGAVPARRRRFLRGLLAGRVGGSGAGGAGLRGRWGRSDPPTRGVRECGGLPLEGLSSLSCLFLGDELWPLPSQNFGVTLLRSFTGRVSTRGPF